jgi:hypothetical protein
MRKILMSTGHRLLKWVRQIHLYLGVFTAPMLLFFAFTGGMQTFSLHETTRGSSYTPPAWLATLAQLHKKQTTVMPPRKPHPAEAAPPAKDSPVAGASAASIPANAATDVRMTAASGAPADNASGRPKKNLLPMKIFFALVALSLMLSTLTGLYMAYRFTRHGTRIALVLLAGIIVPLLLTLL